MPDYAAFNGRPSQYIAEPIRVKAGDRVRFHVVCAGPTHPSHLALRGTFRFEGFRPSRFLPVEECNGQRLL